MDAIPIPDAAPSIALPGDDEQLHKLVMGTGAQAQSIIPKAVSSRGIPVTPQTPNKAIPIDRATGQPEQLNDQGKAIAPGVAGLWTRAENIHNPILRTLGKIGAVGARAIDVAGSVAAPGVMAKIPGTTINQEVGENRAAAQEKADTTNAATKARTAYEEAETNTGIPARAEYEKAQAEALENPQPKPKEEAWEVNPNFQGPNGEPILIEKNSGQMKLATAIPGVQPMKKTQDKPDTPEQQFLDEYQKTHPGASIASAIAAYGATSQKPEREPKQLAIGPDGTVIELRPGVKVPQGTKTVQADLNAGKPTADEQRRADLANNMEENLSQLEEILRRRPDLFGPMHGRMTEMKAAIGTSDPDIAALKTIHEQMGMAMVGAHAMRNAQHVEAAANAVFNAYHNSPDAIAGAIKAARNSLQTFKQDVDRATGSATQANEPPRPANVPAGYVFKENGPKGRGWYKP